MIMSDTQNTVKDYVRVYVSDYTLCKPQYYGIHFYPMNHLSVGRIPPQYLQSVLWFVCTWLLFVRKFPAIKFHRVVYALP